MFCAIFGLLTSPIFCASLDLLPTDRPPYAQFAQWYGPDPDCANRNSHVRYLAELKRHPVKSEDDAQAYDQAIDQYMSRLEYYCR